MKYRINGTTMQTVEVALSQGESVYTTSGGMAWMTPNISMSSNMKGGLFGGLSRALSGASMFLVDYTCGQGEGMVTFASKFVGKVLDFTLTAGQGLICQKDAFLAAQPTVTLEAFFQRRLGAGLFGGEGFVLQKVGGTGTAFVDLSGEIMEYTLAANQVIRVEPGHVGLFEPTVSFDISMVKGIKNIFFSGEGLFLADLRGPGKVWLQSMPLSNLAARLAPYLPNKSSS
jgi:uncharacterized protein (TIGR00266 family)